MVLKKPYAILIKNFKKIHLLLSALLIFLSYQTTNLLTFFNEYISSGRYSTVTSSLANTYLNLPIFIAVVAVVLISIAIFILMRQKNKPTLIYLLMIGFYLGLFIYFIQSYVLLDSLEYNPIDPRAIRAVRDFCTIITYSQYALSIAMLVRAVGFDIKKFNFGEDLSELQIEVSDNEEFELTMGVDTDKIGRKVRRSKREFKYFLLENKFIILLISAIVILISLITTLINFAFLNKIYTMNDSFKSNDYIIELTNAQQTNLNQKGELIASLNKTYIVVNLNITNLNSESRNVLLDDLSLEIENRAYKPIVSLYDKFIDFGSGLNNQKLKQNQMGNYVIVFEVEKDSLSKEILFRYCYKAVVNRGVVKQYFQKVRLYVNKEKSIEIVGQTSLSKELNFKNKPLYNSKIKIDYFLIANKIPYEIMQCYEKNCNTDNRTLVNQQVDKKIMKLYATYIVDKKVTIKEAGTVQEILKNYGFFEYEINSKKYRLKLVDITPKNINGKELFFLVPDVIEKFDNLKLIIQIRTNRYEYQLK